MKKNIWTFKLNLIFLSHKLKFIFKLYIYIDYKSSIHYIIVIWTFFFKATRDFHRNGSLNFRRSKVIFTTKFYTRYNYVNLGVINTSAGHHSHTLRL